MIEIRDHTGTRRVQSRRLAALIRALLANEGRLPLDGTREGKLTLWWNGDRAGVETVSLSGFTERSGGQG